MAIVNISDTASWIAYFRALETERPDALFKDRFARQLAGAAGERLARQLGQAELIERVIAVRTAVFDELIIECVSSRGVDLVVNLGAGLDTRPWRLPLPSTVQWVDVDLPAILDHKASVLRGEPSRCEYRAMPADLADQKACDAIFARLNSERRCALIITEGLLVYLTPSRVSALARALHRNESFRWWLTDLTGPKGLEVLATAWQPAFAADKIKFQFAPPESTGFFAPLGWQEETFRSAPEEAQRLRRLPPLPLLSRALIWLSSASRREEFRRLAGTALMRRE
jgi:methyltransferase (TIGR00027 family)